MPPGATMITSKFWDDHDGPFLLEFRDPNGSSNRYDDIVLFKLWPFRSGKPGVLRGDEQSVFLVRFHEDTGANGFHVVCQPG